MGLEVDPKEYMSVIIEKLKDKSLKEILSYAIFNEEEEAKYYNELFKLAKRESIKVLFVQMSEESLKHREYLYAIFKKLYPNEEPVKVELPPVEVAPFYPKFIKVEDYVEALKYCMESELFAKKSYELLAKKTQNEEAKAIFVQLALMEEDHYTRLKKAYELLKSMAERDLTIGDFRSGGYLIEDKTKARYFFLDILKDNYGIVLTRDNPNEVRNFLKKDLPIFWVTKNPVPNAVHPNKFTELKRYLTDLIKEKYEGREWALLIEGIGYLVLELGFKNVMDVLVYLKDYALSCNGYVVISARKELFDPKEWAILTSEFELIP